MSYVATIAVPIVNWFIFKVLLKQPQSYLYENGQFGFVKRTLADSVFWTLSSWGVYFISEEEATKDTKKTQRTRRTHTKRRVLCATWFLSWPVKLT